MLKNLLAILTDATCGATCWYAKEDTCRCSCGGKNHGALLDPDNPQPERIVTMGGTRYKLEAVGFSQDIYKISRRVLAEYGWAKIHKDITYVDGGAYHYAWQDTDKGSPVRVVYYRDDLHSKWPEVQLYKQGKAPSFRPHLLFRKLEKTPVLYCEGKCERCDMKRWDTFI